MWQSMNNWSFCPYWAVFCSLSKFSDPTDTQKENQKALGFNDLLAIANTSLKYSIYNPEHLNSSPGL